MILNRRGIRKKNVSNVIIFVLGDHKTIHVKYNKTSLAHKNLALAREQSTCPELLQHIFSLTAIFDDCHNIDIHAS